jgi:hypothetical protein
MPDDSVFQSGKREPLTQVFRGHKQAALI